METLFIGAVGLAINFALAVLAFRTMMKLDAPIPGVEPVEQPKAPTIAQILGE
ncbi:MAG: hypothetical protein ABWZ27_13700 [Aestuariivirgaceae bacterium]|jgi:hypothetical protein